MSLDRILITGASSDLGLGLLGRLAAREPRPEILAHCHAGRERLRPLELAFGPGLQMVEADLAAPEGTDAVIAAVRERWGLPDAFVHFAGLPLRLERFRNWDPERFQKDLAIQFLAHARILQAFLPGLARAQTPSSVVFVLSSVVHGVPPRFMSMYTAVKYAQLGLMKAVAAEYAGTPVRINAVSPSMVETRYLAELPGKAVELGAAQMPHGRNLQAGEVAGVLEWLLSPDSLPMHGADLLIADGSVF
jgi:3-oxoacyl-[acyl-carrier protein] reductase